MRLVLNADKGLGLGLQDKTRDKISWHVILNAYIFLRYASVASDCMHG